MTRRYLLSLDAQWRLEVRCGTVMVAHRDIQRATVPHAQECHVPVAPELTGDEVPQAASKLARLTSRLAHRDFRNDAVRETGRLLYEALFGKLLWDQIIADFRVAGATLLELALQWPAGDADLHRLNWELMCRDQQFLAQGGLDAHGRLFRIAITRVVGGATFPGQRLNVPTRFLFAVGASLDDPEINPGAEYLALMRQLERSELARLPELRMLTQATPARLQATVAEFKPDIVHIVAHGQIEKDEVVLKLHPDPNEAPGSNLLTGKNLAERLRRDENGLAIMPPLIVLSACFTGAVDDFDAQPTFSPGSEKSFCLPTPPLAVQLVAAGTPVVIGMGGRVADRACRLFTQFFCNAILRGRPLADSLERGRRGGFTTGEDPSRTHDWALPVLFLAEGVTADFCPTTPFATGEKHPVNSTLASLNLQPQATEPVFAARFECVEEKFEALFHDKPVLVLVGPLGSGKSRLLKELAARTVRAGHLPIFLDGKATEEAITTTGLLRTGFLDAYRRSGGAYGFEWAGASQMRMLPADGDPAKAPPSLKPEVAALLQEDKKLTPRVFREALLFDAKQFVVDATVRSAQGAGGGPFAKGGYPVVFLGHLELLPQEFVERLLSTSLLTAYGLGDAALPIPVVASIDSGKSNAHLTKAFAEKQMPAAWFDVVALDPLLDEAAVRACERVLLHPHNAQQIEAARKPWILDRDAPPEIFARRIKKLTKSYWNPAQPIGFMEKPIYLWVDEACEDKVARQADDNDIIRELEK